MEKIKIFDTTLRDGEQSPGCSMTLEEKVRVAKQLEKLGVDVIEAGFAASSEKDLHAIQEISKAVSEPVITSLARLRKEDIDKAAESLKYAKKKRIHTFIATSPIHMKDKLHMTEEEVLAAVRENVRYARSKCEDIEFSLEDATRTEMPFMIKVIEEAIAAGATTINIPDTVGFTIPTEYYKMIREISKNVRGIEGVTLSAHCHNDLGMAVANSLIGVQAGIGQVECTVNGIGERAGNAALEQIAMALHVRGDEIGKKTNINVREIIPSSRLISEIVGEKPERTHPIVGANVNKHEAGIHQHGVMQNKDTYEIVNFSELGVEDNGIVIGIHSGAHAIVDKINSLGIEITNDQARDYVNSVKAYLADNKTISDEMLVQLAQPYQASTKAEPPQKKYTPVPAPRVKSADFSR